MFLIFKVMAPKNAMEFKGINIVLHLVMTGVAEGGTGGIPKRLLSSVYNNR